MCCRPGFRAGLHYEQTDESGGGASPSGPAVDPARRLDGRARKSLVHDRPAVASRTVGLPRLAPDRALRARAGVAPAPGRSSDAPAAAPLVSKRAARMARAPGYRGTRLCAVAPGALLVCDA